MVCRSALCVCLLSLVLGAALTEAGRRGGRRRGFDSNSSEESGRSGRRGSGERDDRRRPPGLCFYQDVVNAMEVTRDCPAFHTCDTDGALEISQDGAVLYRMAFCAFDAVAFLSAVDCNPEDDDCGTFQVDGNDVSLNVDENGKITPEVFRRYRPTPPEEPIEPPMEP